MLNQETSILIEKCLDQITDLRNRKKRGVRSLNSKAGYLLMDEHLKAFNTLKSLKISAETWKHLKSKYINNIYFKPNSLAPWCYQPSEAEMDRLTSINTLFDSLAT